jgi:hypothetical protein
MIDAPPPLEKKWMAEKAIQKAKEEIAAFSCGYEPVLKPVDQIIKEQILQAIDAKFWLDK